MLLFLESAARDVPPAALAKAAEELSAIYRADRPGGIVPPLTDLQRLAYAVVRMPATYAAVAAVLTELRARVPQLEVESLTDLGSGPGTALWAAMDLFPSIRSMKAIERDAGFRKLAAQLAADHLPKVEWLAGDLAASIFPKADLVVMSYALGELPPAARIDVVTRAWKAAGKSLVIIEPGTTPGFAAIADARRVLLAGGAHVAAPCPHERECPLVDAPGWCHFTERLERSRRHRQVKGGDLGYEDEKYSYVAFVRDAVDLPKGRVLGRPKLSKVEVRFECCGSDAYKEVTVPRREKEAYKAARKLDWGDVWPE